MRKDFAPLLSIALLTTVAATASAQVADPQDLAILRATVSTFATGLFGPQPASTRLFVEPGALDDRLRLARCAAPEAFLPAGAKPAARFTVGVRCASPAWSVYLPVTVESELSVLVLRAPAGSGATLTANEVEPQRRRVAGFATLYLTDAAQLAGRHLKQAAPPGTALNTDLLVPDIKVKRGQRVTLIAATGGFEVRAQGEAIADARPDGRVRVQNLSSGKIIEGRVETADIVRVGP